MSAEVIADHVVEALSGRVPGTLSHRDELWDQCYQELMASAQARIEQEVHRLGGDYAHVHDESIDSSTTMPQARRAARTIQLRALSGRWQALTHDARKPRARSRPVYCGLHPKLRTAASTSL